MRILAIRGENLASLGQPFTVDFEAEPLAGAGLFAITGETGSGKSTILDALCLALYGRYPRFAEQMQDSSPDPGGRVRILDGSAILRRGAGRGYAEVDFRGRAESRYRARWEARRSRDKADGPIQGAERKLYEVTGDSLTPLATSKTEVQSRIEEITGLTFDQFRRTVLLAQGDFDSFLLAPEKERGDLLSKITGTEIYEKISIAVHRGAAVLSKEVSDLEQKMTNMGLMAPAEHVQLVQTVVTLRQTVQRQTDDIRQMQAKLHQAVEYTRAQDALTAAEATLAAAEDAWTQRAAERVELAAFDAAEPLRPQRTRLSEHVDAVPALQRLAAERLDGLRRAGQQAATDDAALIQAQSARDEAERIFKDFGPQWDKAAGLDSAALHAQKEAGAATEHLKQAQQDTAGLTSSTATLDQQVAASAQELARLEQAKTERSRHILLANRLEDAETLFACHAQLTQTTNEAQTRSQRARDQEQKQQVIVNQLRAVAIQQTISLQAAEQHREALRRDLAARDLAGLEALVTQHTALLNEVRTASGHAAAYTAAELTLGRAAQQAASAALAAQQAETRRTEAARLLDEQRRQRARLTPQVDLAQESIAQRAIHLRSLVLDGEACPVCGAAEHPYLAPGATDALTALAGQLRDQRDALDGAIDRQQHAEQRAAIQYAAQTGYADAAIREQDQASATRTSAQATYAEQQPALASEAANLGLAPAPPDLLSDQAASLLRELEANARGAGGALAAQVGEARRVRHQTDQADTTHTHAQQALTATQASLKQGEDALHAAQIETVTAAGAVDAAQQQILSQQELIQPFLACLDLTSAGLMKGPKATLRAIRTAAGELRSLRIQVEELIPNLATLNSDHRRELQRLAQAKQQQADALKANQQRANDLAAATAARALLLGGEPTEIHRSRTNRQRTAASDALDQAGRTAHDAALAREKAETEHKQAESALATASQALDQVRTGYTAACAEAGLSRDVADTLLDKPTSVAAALRTSQQFLSGALNAAKGERSLRLGDVEQRRAEALEDEARAALGATLEHAQEQERANRETLGDADGRLKRDLDLRQSALALQAKAKDKQAELDTWQEVNQAIGSADGDRFRRFAQSLTLDQLVILANEHLDTFTKRYHLARSPASELALHVTDLDMADEQRPVRSLSGGERFLVSLSLALALSGLEGRDFFVDTLFIDEGFGSLDLETLDMATAALESLHSRGRKVGVITHVAAMIDSIPVQIRVDKLGGGTSVVRLVGAPPQ